MDREPVYYAETRFVVDGFHYKSHVGCSRAFDHRQHDDLDSINRYAKQGYKLKKGDLLAQRLSVICLIIG